MDTFPDYIEHWKTLDSSDLLGIIFIIIIVLVTIGSDLLFKSFIRSKPDGRKTVLGKKEV